MGKVIDNRKVNTMKYCPTCKKVYTIHLVHGQLVRDKVNYLPDFPSYGKERAECIQCQEKELKEYVEKKYGEKNE
tara:strand:- start:169 stop:393 length:225 start_codon:yes stop_codon:yes gene_type:complete